MAFTHCPWKPRAARAGGRAAILLALIWAAPAAAQYYYPYPVVPYGPAPVSRAPGPMPGTRSTALPPGEIRAIVRNLGYGQVGVPVLQGRTYVVNALGADGPLALAVDAFTGRVSAFVPRGGTVQGGPASPGRAGPPALAARTPPDAPPAPPAPKPRPLDVQTAGETLRPAAPPAPQAPQAPPQVPAGQAAGMGTATPGDTVSAGSPSVLSRGSAGAE